MKLLPLCRIFASALLLCSLARAQNAAQPADDQPIQIRLGVVPPKIMRKVEPRYSAEGRNAGVQGSVVLSIIIDRSGVPRDIEVLSPLGFGMDETAIEAVSAWRFQPATKDGQPVSVQANVVVTFRLIGEHFDATAERNRSDFNVIASRLNKGNKPTEADIKRIRELAKHKLPGADYVLGTWEMEGLVVPADKADGLERIQRAADKSYGPAMYFVGNAKYHGTLMPLDVPGGLKLMQDAAVLGSAEAQLTMGRMYESGTGVEPDRERAQRYYRLCAANAVPACEFQLGQMLLAPAAGKQSNLPQAIAWLELAAGHRFPGAEQSVQAAAPKLNQDQKRWVDQWKQQLERTR